MGKNKNQNQKPIPKKGQGPTTPNKQETPTSTRPNPWLGMSQPRFDPQASFVEYLRWMRAESGNDVIDSGTKTQLLQLAVENGNYRKRLQHLCDRIPKLAGPNGRVLKMKCPWRIRVGGQKGPENMLLPAFDQSGMPFIPATTLRGIARAQAIAELMQGEGRSRENAEKEAGRYFGDLDPEQECDHMGKVIFFDAYPLPGDSKTGGLSLDIVNNIWKWEQDSPSYQPIPNSFLSLEEPTFVIGVRPMPHCPEETFQKMVAWLQKGLTRLGAGSQVGSGYGLLLDAEKEEPGKLPREFFRIRFELEGQAIHANQPITDSSWRQNPNNQSWSLREPAEAEVRPIAFKSAMRYWFRCLALGVLPAQQVREIEAQIFGGIDMPRNSDGETKRLGWLQVHVLNGGTKPNGDKKTVVQTGELVLCRSSQSEDSKDKKIMLATLTWLALHLGGVGQGSRRPLYERNSSTPPFIRGTQLATTHESHPAWKKPGNIEVARKIFIERLQSFYDGLSAWSSQSEEIDLKQPLEVQVTATPEKDWAEVIDKHAVIALCDGSKIRNKPFSLGILHDQSLNKHPLLCGTGSIPSPVWIATPWRNSDIQVITVFRGDRNQRKEFLDLLKKRTDDTLKYIWREGLRTGND